jgi:hypothetical protein
MAYTSGDTILDNHYNDFATSVNTIWGTGSGARGLGQTSTVSSVSAGTTITATQWATLLNRIRSISDHQGNDASITIDTVTNPVAGNTISAFTTLSTDIGTCYTDAATAANNDGVGFGTAITDTAALATTLTGTITQTNTLTFASANQMRYGWNAGGKVQVSWSLSGGTSDDKYNNWVALATACGTYVINAHDSGKSGGSGTTNTNLTNRGFWDMNTTATNTFRQYEDTSPYTASYIQLNTSTNASPGSSTVMTLTSLWVDAAADQVSYTKNIYNVLDQVDGTKTTTFSWFPAATTYISNTWGTPTWSTTVNSHA